MLKVNVIIATTNLVEINLQPIVHTQIDLLIAVTNAWHAINNGKITDCQMAKRTENRKLIKN